jgi:hypothetical protein
MATNPAANAHGDSFLLELLQLAGWQLPVRDTDTARIRTRRGEVELEVTGAKLAEAAGTVFARAMRSNSSCRGN